MGDDASSRSQSAQATPRPAEMREFMAEVGARLAALERDRRMAEIMDSAGQPLTPPPPRRRKRDRHGLHIVRGCALLGACGRWLVRSHAHRALAGGLIVATATGATLAPDMMQRAPAAIVHAPRHHRHEVHRHRPVAPSPNAPPVVRRRRRYLDADSDDAARHVAAPLPVPSAVPSPAGTPGPVPDPEPSVTVPPVPTPDPTCTVLHGHHCSDGGDDVVSVLGGALRGLSGSL